MGGPKVPSNYKDPEKIQAKIEEWELNSEEKSVEYPLARVIDGWCLLNKDGVEVCSGTGYSSLLSTLKKHDKDITFMYGYDIRTVMKIATIQALEAKCEVPELCWVRRFNEQGVEICRLFDTLALLTSGYSDKLDEDLLLSRIGLKHPMDMTTAEERAKFAHKLHSMCA